VGNSHPFKYFDLKQKTGTITNSGLFGLVLSGGKSTRMGMDKGTLAYHGKPQREYLYDLLDNYCARTFLSIRSEQRSEFVNGQHLIIDNDAFRGPFNGLLSAHDQYPDKAWIVLACDLPLMNLKTIETLIGAWDQSGDATALATRESGLPEPLAAIWEPCGLAKAKKYIEDTGNSCPRKFLIRMAKTSLVHPNNDQVLYNANFHAEYQEVQTKLRNL
jgi:molybdopterin-guanine dinucleotide biosynthesis protein A